MEGLTHFERAILDKLLAGDHPVLAILRQQFEHARLARRETTGVGFFCDFEVDNDTPALQRDIEIGDVHADVEGLAHGAGFVLFVRGGRLSLLEGFSYDEPWPDQIRAFSLRYSDSERKSALAKLS